MDPYRIDYNDLAVMVEPPEKIIPKEDWGAVPAVSEVHMETPVSNVFLTFTKSRSCASSMECALNIQQLQGYFMEVEKKDDVPYNFLVGGNGFVYQGRGWNVQPDLPERYSHLNDRSLYIACVGHKGVDGATGEMYIARDELIKYGVDNNYITKRMIEYKI